MTNDDYKILQPKLPTDPGVYQFIGQAEEVLYVGKAKNLKNRISSYFTNKNHQRFRTHSLVKNAARVQFTIVHTEQDALLLENTLIKKYQPKYNVQLKDGKTYPYICITKERFPRVFFTRKKLNTGASYFGPYTSKYKMNVILDLIKQLFKLRTCALSLTEKNITAGKFKVCLEYHIKNCEGGCVGKESHENYMLKIEQIRNILKGKFAAVKQHLNTQLEGHVELLEFERAHEVKTQLDALNDYQSKSTVVNPRINDVDVFSIIEDDARAFVNFMRIANGAVVYAHSFTLEKQVEESIEDLLVFGIYEIWRQFGDPSKELYVPFPIPQLSKAIRITVPEIGDKRKLIEMSLKNATYHKLHFKKDEVSRLQKVSTTDRLLATIKKDLRLSDLPVHMEAFDNSNIQGAFPVSSMVLFRNAKPAKREYRHYNVKTVVGPDDFASMEEVVYRRYSRLLSEGASLPQLILIDGGKGQLSSAVKALEELNILNKVTVIGIAKRLEEIFYPGESIPLMLNKKSETLKVMQHMRNESHRFAITFHRNQRSKDFTTSELVSIPGVGELSADKLLIHFKSISKVKAASENELAGVVGRSIAKKVYRYFQLPA